MGAHDHSPGEQRGRPRPWRHDYLHLRAIAADLHTGAQPRRLLDLGSGGAPYRDRFASPGTRYVRCDLDPARHPDVVARAERLPFAAGAFDAVLSTQILGLVDDPQAAAREIARVLAPGGRAWITLPAAYPYDGLRVEHRFGEPQLRALFSALDVVEIRAQGGLLALPFVLANVSVREAVRAAERRLQAAALLRLPAAAFYLAANGCGRLLEALSTGGPLAGLLRYLDGRMPMNFLVVAGKRP